MKVYSARNALVAILLIVAAASLGITAKLYLLGITGQVLLILTRVWMLALPVMWEARISRSTFTLSRPTRQEWITGTGLGLVMFGVILAAYGCVGQYWIDTAAVRTKAQQVGLTTIEVYLLSAFYFTALNSLAEEFIWRWFVYRKCEVLLSGFGAVWLAALCFMLHHSIALLAYTQNGLVVVLGSFGVFAGGSIWSWCYLTYRSLWPGYISHVLADLAIAFVGWHILFG